MSAAVYLAGPEVFMPNGHAIAQAMRETCIANGLTPISPLDKDAAPDEHRSLADVIFANNLEMIDRADAVIANLNHFRGPDPDAGTSWELGYGFARGKRCFVFSDDGDTAVERVERFYGPVTRKDDGTPLDHDGVSVENFGAPYNLMLSSSSTVVVGTFEDAVRAAAAALLPA